MLDPKPFVVTHNESTMYFKFGWSLLAWTFCSHFEGNTQYRAF